MTSLRHSFAFRLAAVFAGLSLLSVVYTYTRRTSPSLTLEIGSSHPAIAQLFYDTGHGFRQADSVTVALQGRGLQSFETVSFALPRRTVQRLRFDPSTDEGQSAIRSAAVMNRTAVLRIIPLTSFKGVNQIVASDLRNNVLRITTIAGANDPILNIDLDQPLRLRWIFAGQNLFRLGVINLALVCLYFPMLSARRGLSATRDAILSVNRVIECHFTSAASRLTGNGNFLRFDAFSLYVYAGLLIWLAVAGSLRLNGSSTALYSTSYGNGPFVKPLLGAARSVRSDEWAYCTPDILNQYYRDHRFDATESVLGNHNVALIANVPVWNFSTLFRPQFWAFFFLPLEYAFAIYWQAKALLLIGGVFTMLLWICESSKWALCGSLWYFFSAFTQWTYSWPSALPEMTGSVCLATVCCCYLTVGRSKVRLTIAALAGTLFSVNFAMCGYPPHLIPLIWLALTIIVAWCAANWRRMVQSEGRAYRAIAIGFLAIAVGVVGGLAIQELKPAILAVSNTTYPGHRIIPAGTMPLWLLGSHFLQWGETEVKFPAAIMNISEGSGFLWLAPLTLLLIGRLRASAFQKVLWVALWVYSATFVYWCAWAAPPLLGHLTLLERSGGTRLLPALGLVNVGLVVLSGARVQNISGRMAAIRQMVYFCALGILFYLVLQYTNEHLGHYFQQLEVVSVTLFLALLAAFLLTGKGRPLAFLLLTPLIVAYGAVNPLGRGLPTLTHSQLHDFVQAHRELLKKRWLVFADTPVRSGFVASSGLEVYTGLRYVPDIDHFALFAKRGLDLNVFNRLGFLNGHAITAPAPSRFVETATGLVRWEVAPNDPLLRQLGISYLAFDYQPSPELTAGLTLLSPVPVDNLWLYQINGT